MKRVRKNRGKNADMAAKSFTPSHLPTTTIPNNCPTDCSTLLNSNGTKTWTSISKSVYSHFLTYVTPHLLYCYL